MTDKISWVRYVPHGFVDAYIRDGWHVLPKYFESAIHHSHYAVAMAPGPDVRFEESEKYGGLAPADPAERKIA